jgi:hypothetical protein
MTPPRQQRAAAGAAQPALPALMAAAAAAHGRPTIATLYELWTLDIIPCLGQPCAALCRDYPHEFKNVPAATLATLADLRYRTGYDSRYLDEQGRKVLVMPVLGESDGAKGGQRSGAFHQSADALRCRARDFVWRVFDTGEDQLRGAFRDAASSFKKYLTAVEGNVVADARVRLTGHFGDVVAILQAPQFAAGLGLPPAPGAGWPLNLASASDGDGAVLVCAVTTRAQASGGKPIVTDVEFEQIQRIAMYGGETIEAVLNVPAIWDNDGIANEAITLAYLWSSAIAELAGRPVTATR